MQFTPPILNFINIKNTVFVTYSGIVVLQGSGGKCQSVSLVAKLEGTNGRNNTQMGDFHQRAHA